MLAEKFSNKNSLDARDLEIEHQQLWSTIVPESAFIFGLEYIVITAQKTVCLWVRKFWTETIFAQLKRFDLHVRAEQGIYEAFKGKYLIEFISLRIIGSVTSLWTLMSVCRSVCHNFLNRFIIFLFLYQGPWIFCIQSCLEPNEP